MSKSTKDSKCHYVSHCCRMWLCHAQLFMFVICSVLLTNSISSNINTTTRSGERLCYDTPMNKSATWEAAQHLCLSVGGSLPSLTTNSADGQFFDIAKKSSANISVSTGKLCIGLKQLQGIWTWNNGLKLGQYKSWANGEVNNGSNAKYAFAKVSQGAKHHGEWWVTGNDSDECTPVICQKTCDSPKANKNNGLASSTSSSGPDSDTIIFILMGAVGCLIILSFFIFIVLFVNFRVKQAKSKSNMLIKENQQLRQALHNRPPEIYPNAMHPYLPPMQVDLDHTLRGIPEMRNVEFD